jgi:hypothetical protein
LAKKVDSYKALTVVNLPFIEERYEPGEMIPREKFDAMVEQAAAVLDDRTAVDENASPLWTAEDHIAELTEWGSISDDPDAPLHPESIIPNPNEMTVGMIVARAKALVEQLEAGGAEIPAKLREFAGMSEQQIAEADRSRVMISANETVNRSAENAG